MGAIPEAFTMRTGLFETSLNRAGSLGSGAFLGAAAAAALLLCANAGMAAPAWAPQGSTPVPGEIAVSEILFNPANPVDDNDGEYFEVTNISTRILDLSNLYFQDTAALGSASAPYFRVPAGVLPPLYPGEAFVFARKGDPAVNGAIPKVDYVYSVNVGQSAPSDKSKVSHTGMAFSNSSVDSVAISLDAPANMGGFILEMVSYDPTKAPFNVNNGIAFERANLYGPFLAGNVTASKGTFGSVPQAGTPGAMNSNDATLYSTWYKFDVVNPLPGDKGVLLASGPASVHRGYADLKLAAGAPGSSFAIGIAEEQLTWQLLNGTCLLDFATAHFLALPDFVLDSAGEARLTVLLPAGLEGMQFWVQSYIYDPASASLSFSNALGVDIAP